MLFDGQHFVFTGFVVEVFSSTDITEVDLTEVTVVGGFRCLAPLASLHVLGSIIWVHDLWNKICKRSGKLTCDRCVVGGKLTCVRCIVSGNLTCVKCTVSEI